MEGAPALFLLSPPYLTTVATASASFAVLPFSVQVVYFVQFFPPQASIDAFSPQFPLFSFPILPMPSAIRFTTLRAFLITLRVHYCRTHPQSSSFSSSSFSFCPFRVGHQLS